MRVNKPLEYLAYQRLKLAFPSYTRYITCWSTHQPNYKKHNPHIGLEPWFLNKTDKERNHTHTHPEPGRCNPFPRPPRTNARRRTQVGWRSGVLKSEAPFLPWKWSHKPGSEGREVRTCLGIVK